MARQTAGDQTGKDRQRGAGQQDRENRLGHNE